MSQIQKLFDQIDNGENLLFHGPGGTGKSFSIKTIYDSYSTIKNIIMVAPTAIASVNLGENTRTIGSIFRIPPKNTDNMTEDEIKEEIKNVVKGNRYNKQIENLDLLIVDEISMVGKFYMDVMDKVLRSKNDKNLIFGGVQVIFSGDYYQLAPVKDSWGFESKSWDELNLKLIEFEDSKRYDNDLTFKFMKRLRLNKLTDEDKELLESRQEAYKLGLYKKLEIEPIRLYSYKKNVEDMNNTNLLAIKTKMHTSTATDEIIIKNNKNIKNKVANLLNCLCDKVINYKIGAKIMIIKNISLELRLVNGILGIILDVEENHVKIKIDDGSIHWISRCVFKVETNEYIGTREQFPFRTAWAITIHKCQGISLNSAIINLEKVFVPGQAYVAISRVKNINNLFIDGEINYDKIKSNIKLPKLISLLND